MSTRRHEGVSGPGPRQEQLKGGLEALNDQAELSVGRKLGCQTASLQRNKLPLSYMSESLY